MTDQTNSMDTLITISKRILLELELLTSSIKAESLLMFQNDFLVTDQKRRIYNAIDGERDSQSLADVVSCTPRTVQLLIKELQEKDLISIEKRSRSIIPSKATSKIATYYARLNIIKAGGEDNE